MVVGSRLPRLHFSQPAPLKLQQKRPQNSRKRQVLRHKGFSLIKWSGAEHKTPYAFGIK